ncbi:hypothetical protein K488DRAFT_36030, partial [Vararia minispora EC-137]
NKHVNTMVTALESSHWEKLLQRTGEDLLYHLLTKTCIFVRLANDCLCQITGEPLVYRKLPTSATASAVSTASSAVTTLPIKRVLPGDENPRKRARL